MKLLIPILILSIVLIAGCIEEIEPTPTTNGILQIKITDEADEISSLVLTINEIKVHRNTGEILVNQSEGQETNETDNSGWITVVGTKTIDLIQVKGIEEILGETTLSTGKYTQVRLSVSNVTATIDNETHNLKVPSKTIKFVHPFEIKENEITSLIIDFDADKSIVKAGKKYILKPVVKIITEKPEEIDLEELCIESGGNVTTGLCCLATDDFPDTCLIGACACSPTNSHEVKVCDCGEGKCWSNGCKTFDETVIERQVSEQVQVGIDV